MRPAGRFPRLLAALLALRLALPVEAALAAAGTRVSHEPPEDYLPGFRVALEAEVKAEGGIRCVRCYFRSRIEPNFVYVEMEKKKGRYVALLPAPWLGSQAVEYLFVVVNESKQVYRTPLHHVPERPTPLLKKWKETGETREVRLDRVQEFAELYAALLKASRRLGRHERLPDWQEPVDEDAVQVWTEAGAANAQVGGFWDVVVVNETAPELACGLLVDGIYTPAQVAAAGGADAVAAATGAQAVAATAGSGAGWGLWPVLGGIAVLGGAGAAVAASGALDGGGGALDVRDATAADFVGTYDATDPNRPPSSYRAVFEFRSGGTGAVTEYVAGHTLHTAITWGFDEARDVFSFAAHPGGSASGRVTGTVDEFDLAGVYSNGLPASFHMVRR